MDEEIPPEFVECAAELTRIYGDLNMKRFLLLPFQTISETIMFLRSVRDGAGEAGVIEALGRRRIDASADDQSKP